MKAKKDYIYLDTNITSDFKLFDNHQWDLFKKVQKNYYIPFSHAHLFDLSNSPKKYLSEDLHLIERISDGYFLNGLDINGKFSIVKLEQNIEKFFEKVIETHKKEGETEKQNRKYYVPDYDRHKVELSKMHKKSFLTDMIIKNNGILDDNLPNIIMSYLIENLESPSAYKSFRKQVQDAIAHSKKYNTYKNLPKQYTGFLEIFSGSLTDDECFTKLTEYMRWAGRINGDGFDVLSAPQQIVNIYSILDLVKGFSEDFSSTNKWSNMYYDGQHCANASQSKFFISKEKNNKSKYDIIKREFKLKYQEITLDSLLFRFL